MTADRRRLDPAAAESVADLAGLLRELRRRHARQRGGGELTYRELAARSGWSTTAVAEYLTGHTLPPTDRFDVLLGLLGATPTEQGALATARDRVAERHRRPAHRDTGPRASLPRQLPGDVAAFTGRDRHLDTLDGLLPSGDAVAIVVVSGTAGVGKTALVVHWAHRVADQFPDGQLYVNLRGYDPDRPVAPADALARLLGALGTAPADVPADVDDRAALYRSRLVGRRVLVVLDNAATAEQVRPLLPGSGPGMVVVTSRDSLAGFVARDGARRVVLDPLPRADATALLGALIGARATDAPDATAALAERCSRLPLALRLAAELAVARPATPVAELAAELADRQERLVRLDAGGDPRAAVTAVFHWSVQHLPPAVARMFRLLGLHPGTDVDAYAVAALAGTDLAEARRGLDALARAHLVHPTPSSSGAGRFGTHDLLRAYAARLAAEEDGGNDRRVAVARLLDLYLAVAGAAMDRMHPADAGQRPRVPAVATPAPDLAGADEARAWLDAERSNLVAAVAHAAAHGWPAKAVALGVILTRYLDGGHFDDALAVHGHALRAATATGDLTGQARALLNIGATHLHLCRLADAGAALRDALGRFEAAGDRPGHGHALNTLAKIERRMGNSERAVEHLHRALAVGRESGDAAAQARVLVDLAAVEAQRGRAGLAVDHLTAALDLVRAAGHRFGEAAVLVNLGLAEVDLDRFDAADEHLTAALAAFRGFGNRQGEAWALADLGRLRLRRGEQAAAVELFTAGLAIFRETGDREGQASALIGLGDTAPPAGALASYRAALELADGVDMVFNRARAHAGLARAYRALGDAAAMRTHAAEALEGYAHLGSTAPETDDLRSVLFADVRDPGRNAGGG
ncbi:ATP-binding protein [Virgisporangium aurantiacum]|uniref:HTH cro/C1-type domain-containing protein n=1 Tax=Virgisporangium aurantiacum TaxID=175570 RepID=A0A8J3Z848_9ACTN|nr:tetratricopeptide repeat protein [Virgisporangium aurantiacum]GIJ56976.1 hypothetical protein Vau01_044920 [Virgisporangium aurantiacum]